MILCSCRQLHKGDHVAVALSDHCKACLQPLQWTCIVMVKRDYIKIMAILMSPGIHDMRCAVSLDHLSVLVSHTRLAFRMGLRKEQISGS